LDISSPRVVSLPPLSLPVFRRAGLPRLRCSHFYRKTKQVWPYPPFYPPTCKGSLNVGERTNPAGKVPGDTSAVSVRFLSFSLFYLLRNVSGNWTTKQAVAFGPPIASDVFLPLYTLLPRTRCGRRKRFSSFRNSRPAPFPVILLASASSFHSLLLNPQCSF